MSRSSISSRGCITRKSDGARIGQSQLQLRRQLSTLPQNNLTIAAFSLHLALRLSRLQYSRPLVSIRSNRSHTRRGNLIDLAFFPPHRSLTFHLFGYPNYSHHRIFFCSSINAVHGDLPILEVLAFRFIKSSRCP